MNLEWMIRGGRRRKRLAPTSPGCFRRRRGRLVNDQVDSGLLRWWGRRSSRDGPVRIGHGSKIARISDKYMSSHFHFLRWPEVVFHCKNVPFKRYWRQICLQYLKNHEKFNFGTEGCVKEGSVPKNIDSVCGCTWLMTILIRTTGHLGRQGEDQGAEDKL